MSVKHNFWNWHKSCKPLKCQLKNCMCIIITDISISMVHVSNCIKLSSVSNCFRNWQNLDLYQNLICIKSSKFDMYQNCTKLGHFDTIKIISKFDMYQIISKFDMYQNCTKLGHFDTIKIVSNFIWYKLYQNLIQFDIYQNVPIWYDFDTHVLIQFWYNFDTIKTVSNFCQGVSLFSALNKVCD